ACCEGVMALGGAQPGDRTMLDALLPAADALASAEGNAAERSARMLAAATAGADATRDMAPRRGRASYIGERAIGHPDPGAVAVATWVDALHRWARAA
ncbi:hypothetical protein OY671_009829, partial [Metschnikowia pulcherrima]